MPQPYVNRRKNAKGEMRYTGMYYDLKGKPRSAGTYEDELEAIAAARREQAGQDGALSSMTLAERRAVTMEQFWPIFRQHHPVEAITMTHYHSSWINYIRPYLRKHRVATLESENLRKFFTALRDQENASVTTRKSCRTVLSAMMKLAIEFGYRSDNPVKGLTVGKSARRSIKVINETIFWQLHDTLPLPTQRLFAETIISTGVRFCEAISFVEGDLDYDTCMLSVTKSTVEVPREFHKEGKRFDTRTYTKAGTHRRIKISKNLAEKIRLHVEKNEIKQGELIFPVRLFASPNSRIHKRLLTPEQMAEAARGTIVCADNGRTYHHCTHGAYRKCGCRCAACKQWYNNQKADKRVRTLARRGKIVKKLERTDGNTYLPAGMWSEIWIKARTQVGVDVTPYQLRHSHASLLLANGVPLPDVQARLGHRDLSSTTHYVWALSEESETASNAMDVILGYADKPADPQQVLLARMEAMMTQMQEMMSPALVQQLAAEQAASDGSQHVVSDTLDALGFKAAS